MNRIMRTILVMSAVLLGLAACGDQPAEVAKPAAKAPPPAVSKTAEPKAAPAPAVGKPAPAPDPNKALASRVKAALEAERSLHGQAIDVTAQDGVVSLWGTVADAGERRTAEKVAAAVAGVKSVDNKLAIVKGS